MTTQKLKIVTKLENQHCHNSKTQNCNQTQSVGGGQSGGATRWRVCYQRGLPRLVKLLYIALFC